MSLIDKILKPFEAPKKEHVWAVKPFDNAPTHCFAQCEVCGSVRTVVDACLEGDTCV